MSMKNFRSVVRREIDIIRHDRNLIIVILLAPVVYALFLGSIFTQKIETDIPIVIVDNDRSEISRTLIRDLDAHQLLKVSSMTPNFDSARGEVIDAKAQAIVFIPRDFESGLKSGKAVDLPVYLNTARFLPSNDVNKAVSEVALTMAAGVRVKYYLMKGLNIDEATEMTQPLKGDIRPLFNTLDSYGDFLLPGLFVLILQQTLLFGLSMSVARERELKTLKSLSEKSGGNYMVAVLGKGLPYLILYGSYIIFSLVVLFSLFNLNTEGSYSALAVLLFLFFSGIVGFAIFISSFFKKEIQALQFLVFSSMPLFLISGYSWPVWSMPWPLQVLNQFSPGTPLFLSFVRITQMGAGWSDVRLEMLQLLALAIGWLILAMWRIKIVSKAENQNSPTAAES